MQLLLMFRVVDEVGGLCGKRWKQKQVACLHDLSQAFTGDSRSETRRLSH